MTRMGMRSLVLAGIAVLYVMGAMFAHVMAGSLFWIGNGMCDSNCDIANAHIAASQHRFDLWLGGIFVLMLALGILWIRNADKRGESNVK